MTITLPWWFFVAIFFASLAGAWLGPVLFRYLHKEKI